MENWPLDEDRQRVVKWTGCIALLAWFVFVIVPPFIRYAVEPGTLSIPETFYFLSWCASLLFGILWPFLMRAISGRSFRELSKSALLLGPVIAILTLPVMSRSRDLGIGYRVLRSQECAAAAIAAHETRVCSSWQLVKPRREGSHGQFAYLLYDGSGRFAEVSDASNKEARKLARDWVLNRRGLFESNDKFYSMRVASIRRVGPDFYFIYEYID